MAHSYSILIINICAFQPSCNVCNPIIMPLNHSAAYSRSSRVSKRPQQLLRRSASSSFTNFVQRKSVQRSQSKADVVDDGDDDDDYDDSFDDRLTDIGIVKSLTSDLSIRDVAQTIQYVRSHMFDALPENGGFNSTRIADILSTFSQEFIVLLWNQILSIRTCLRSLYSPETPQGMICALKRPMLIAKS